MESQPQNPEFRNNPENFHPCSHVVVPKCFYHGILQRNYRKMTMK